MNFTSFFLTPRKLQKNLEKLQKTIENFFVGRYNHLINESYRLCYFAGVAELADALDSKSSAR